MRREVITYRAAIDELQKRVKRSGENLLNWFNMFDNDRSGYLEPDNFKMLLK